jgi:spore maturation protein CgeB
MKLVFFVHSLVSDWNHGNAHFLRGVVGALQQDGHEVDVYEPRDGWSRTSLVTAEGAAPLAEFEQEFPTLRSHLFDRTLDVEATVEDADAVVVHEWNDPWLVAAVGASGATALFHDTHHRAVTAPEEMAQYDLSGYAGVLAFGARIAEVYRSRSWHDRTWVWHEAADAERFRPLDRERRGDLVWIGNWGDGERTRELETFLLEPARRLGLSGTIHGVRYPAAGIAAVRRSGLAFGGWLPNHRAPEVFARHRVTVHVPRRPYVEALPGIPTIRVFEALACGIPLVSAPWDDAEHLFRGDEYLRAGSGTELERLLAEVLADDELAAALAARGRETILAQHTCAHRARELVDIVEQLSVEDIAA